MPNDLDRLLTELASARATLAVDADGPICWSPRPLPPELVARLREAKPRLLPLLHATRRRLFDVMRFWPRDWRELWAERAAIMEFDAKLPRAVVEDRAFHELLALVMADYLVRYEPASIPTHRLLGVRPDELAQPQAVNAACR